MKKLIILCLFLVGCGSGEKLVEIHHVDKAALDSFEQGAYGYAKWESSDPYDKCDIYIMDMGEYSSEEEYNYHLGHELRHCFGGYYH